MPGSDAVPLVLQVFAFATILSFIVSSCAQTADNPGLPTEAVTDPKTASAGRAVGVPSAPQSRLGPVGLQRLPQNRSHVLSPGAHDALLAHNTELAVLKREAKLI